MRWLIAAGVLLAAVLAATVVSGYVRRWLERPTGDARRQQVAEPVSRVLYSLLLAGGLVAALGIASPDSLDPLPADFIAFLPRLLIAGLLLLLGGTVATMAANAVGSSLVRSTGKPQPALTRLVRLAVMVVVAVLAVSQLGVNTRIIDTIVEAVVFGLSAALVLLVGFGGRTVAGDVAAGRYVRKLVKVGDQVTVGEVQGIVTAVHGVTVELAGPDGASLHLPHHQLLAGPLRIERPAPTG